MHSGPIFLCPSRTGLRLCSKCFCKKFHKIKLSTSSPVISVSLNKPRIRSGQCPSIITYKMVSNWRSNYSARSHLSESLNSPVGMDFGAIGWEGAADR